MPAGSFSGLCVGVRLISENMLDPCEEYDIEILSCHRLDVVNMISEKLSFSTCLAVLFQYQIKMADQCNLRGIEEIFSFDVDSI